MASWKGKTKGGLLGYKIFVSVLKFFGLSVSYFLLRIVAAYYYLFYWNSNKNIYFLYNKILKNSKLSSVFKIYRSYRIFGQVLIDKIAIQGGFSQKLSYDFNGEHYLHEMVKSKTGGILIGAHLGNWEMAGHLLKRLNTRINILMLDAEHRKIKEYLGHVYKKKEVNIIPIKEDLSHVYLINKALNNSELVCVLGDRFIDVDKTKKMEFMGREALFPTGPFFMATQYNVPVSFVYAVKTTRKHYVFSATQPEIYYSQGNKKIRMENLSRIIRTFISVLEEKLIKYPDNWFNFYDFWDLNHKKNA